MPSYFPHPNLFRSQRPSRWLFAFCLSLILATAAQAGSKVLKISSTKEGQNVHFLVENLENTEITTTIELQLDNLQCSKPLPYTCTLPARQVVDVFQLTPIQNSVTWNYSYTSRYTMGSCDAVHDDTFRYTLPYSPANAYRVSQGYNGTYSHSGPDQYATDFKMPVGTPVHAARGGVVVKVKTDSSTGGGDRKYQNSANYILIRHSDGTLANYAHLQKNGSTVKVGQNVQAGQLIGYSGNTGFSSGPHLHFSVFKTKNGAQRLTIPVQFQTAEGSSITLVEGKTYKNVPVDQQPAVSVVPALAGGRNKVPPGSGSPGPK